MSSPSPFDLIGGNGTRRINEACKPDAKLKNLAGLIQGLSYTEMTKFAKALNAGINEGTKELPEILLDVADEILEK
ncbi:hypothetical protein [Shinella zoogloeoides]|uniref:hypothetical protein n=1 Tax=Shinella zoogloeoides TaxID=352475 RepID=UPI00273E4D98|nr:hypothetical protein [Shinella zoogloeoides]WLR90896.1 hypothetical protein Q9316_00535 [Shinella zoogloeoides]